MNAISCPLCGESGPHQVAEECEPPFRVLVCAGCDCGFVHPLPDRDCLAGAYDESYYEPWQQHHVRARARMWMRRLEHVRRKVPSGRLLEVGAGEGDFLEMAASAGYQVAATEFSEAAADRIRQRLPQVKVWLGEIESLNIPRESFDVAVAWHCLEHMRHPFQALEAMNRALRPGGSLVVAVPNRRNHLMALLYRIFRGKPYPLFSLKAREIHLFHFTPKSLCMALESAGFAVEQIGWDNCMVEPAKIIIDYVAALPTLFGGILWTEAIMATAIKKDAGQVKRDR